MYASESLAAPFLAQGLKILRGMFTQLHRPADRVPPEPLLHMLDSLLAQFQRVVVLQVFVVGIALRGLEENITIPFLFRIKVLTPSK